MLAAVATAAAGPVGFVAFVAGPIAKRLTRGSGPSLVPAALVGALVVVLSDVVGQHLLPVELPVGVVTAAVGAPYLVCPAGPLQPRGGRRMTPAPRPGGRDAPPRDAGPGARVRGHAPSSTT